MTASFSCRVVLTGLMFTVSPPLSPGQDIPTATVSATKTNDGTLFIASIPRPADCGRLTIDDNSWTWWTNTPHGEPPRIPHLSSSPAWIVPAYLEFTWPDENSGEESNAIGPLVFLGHAPPGVLEADLTLRYPKEDRQDWGLAAIHLDLADAPPAAGDPLHDRFALAEANWFRFMASQAPDTGGFYAFAEQQTRRRAGLNTRAPDQNNRRAWSDPSNERYALASGAIAIQEALQLDRMTNPPTGTPVPSIPIADIQPVTIDSHPYDEMRGGAEPADTPLSRLAPADNWFVRFGSIAKLLDLADFGDQWGSSLLRLATASGQDFGVRQRLVTQMCLPDGMLARTIGPAMVGEVAFTGSDAYLRLGSDVTALFAVKNKALFTAAMEPLISQAVADGAARDTVTSGSLTVERILTKDGRIRCHRAWIGDVCVYSNSEAAIRRVAETGAGTLPSLADSPDYRYVRAKVFPFSEGAEDGLVFLSDAFVRRAVSPGLRIAQLRRLQALTSLNMIAHARMLHGWNRGPSNPALDDLFAGGFLTQSDLIDPAGGTFSFDSASGLAASSSWGSMRFMRPLIEVPVDTATEAERDAYDAFRNQYQSYWQRFIDPVAIRIGVGPTITLETHILPLIDLSEYQSMKDFAGGAPVAVDPAKFSEGTLLRFVTKLGDGQMRRSMLTWLGAFSGTNAAADWLGDWATFWVEDSDTLAVIVREMNGASNGRDSQGFDIFRASLVGGIHVKNKLSLATFLVGLRAVINETAPNMVLYSNLEPYGGVTIVKMSPDPAGGAIDTLREIGATSPEEFAFYYATIGDGFYLATKELSLKRLIDATLPNDHNIEFDPAKGKPPAGDLANFYIYDAPGAADSAKPALSAILEAQARQAAISNMAQVELLGRCGLLEGSRLEAAAPAFLGYRLVDPDGADYSYDAATDAARSTIHGTRWSAAPEPGPLPEGSPLADLLDRLNTVSAALRFTEDGLETTVRIDRNGTATK